MSESPLLPFTSESVTEGHPDKVCDRISDALLDAILKQDPTARVALETMATTGLIHVAGEVTTSAYVEIPAIVREEILAIGYDSSIAGFDGATCGVSISIGQQSPDIASGVDRATEVRTATDVTDPREILGAGDQGMMFGYATTETPDLMPAPLWLSHALARRLAEVRKSGIVEGLYPDGKTQVTLGYQDGVPVAVDTVVVSAQHSEAWSQTDLAAALTEAVVAPVLDQANLGLDQEQMKVMVNPSGRFVIGGPASDTGLTGRKIIVDTYGGAVPHGGGAFSGKDPSKVDRSGAYAARWMAKNVVAAGLAQRCQIQLAYAIGSSRPVSISLETFGTELAPREEIRRALGEVFDLRPLGIIEELGLRTVEYKETAAYGHFGRSLFPWEQTNRTDELRRCLGA